MAKITSKGRGRPRKAIPDDRVNRQAEGDDANGIGDGRTSASGLTTQADVTGTSERCTYAELVELIVELNSKHTNKIVSRAWHPDCKCDTDDWHDTSQWIGTNFADVPCFKGEASYQYSNGDITIL